MKLTERHKTVIQCVLADREYWASQAYSGYGNGSEKLRTEAAKEGYVRTDPARWLGMGGKPSDWVQVSRLYNRLEYLGLITRHNLNGSPCTTHLKLTESGEQLAWKLSAAERRFP